MRFGEASLMLDNLELCLLEGPVEVSTGVIE